MGDPSSWHASLGVPFSRSNPSSSYRRLLERGPVEQSTGPSARRSWLVGGYDDVACVLTSPSFASDPAHAGIRLPGCTRPLDRLLTTTDPPEHSRLRAAVRHAFAPAAVEALRSRVQDIVSDLLDAMAATRTVDLLDAFAFPLPMRVIAELLGLPAEDGTRFRRWSRVIIDTDFASAEGDGVVRRQIARQDIVEYLADVLARKRSEPDGGLVAELARSELSEAEAIGLIWLILTDGYEAVACFLGNAVLALVSRPEQYQRLARTPSLVAPAVEELLRFDGPAAMVSRFASEDVELGGRSIRQGEAVTIVLGAANRDGRVFDAPDDVDVERSNVNRHLAFGKGTHFCIGAALARLECQIGLRGLVTRFPALQLALPPSALLWRDSLMLRGLLELPVELDPISCL